MARSPKKTAPSPRETSGFEEAAQAPFEGAPLSSPLAGSVSDWVKQLEAEAEASSHESRRDVASKAGKHRKQVEIAAAKAKAKPVEPALSTKAPKASKSARGTSMGGSSDPKTRAAAGLNPVAGMDMSLEDAQTFSQTLAPGAVTATVDALSKLIESGNPLFKDGKMWTPHRPHRPEKSEGGVPIRMVSDYEPAGDQPTAIADLVAGINDNERSQVLLGVTGSGKTFTMAKVI